MAKTQKEQRIRFRAICTDDSFKGPWRLKEEDAEIDADKHVKEPGKDDHIVRIVKEQTSFKLHNKKNARDSNR